MGDLSVPLRTGIELKGMMIIYEGNCGNFELRLKGGRSSMRRNLRADKIRNGHNSHLARRHYMNLEYIVFSFKYLRVSPFNAFIRTLIGGILFLVCYLHYKMRTRYTKMNDLIWSICIMLHTSYPHNTIPNFHPAQKIL